MHEISVRLRRLLRPVLDHGDKNPGGDPSIALVSWHSTESAAACSTRNGITSYIRNKQVHLCAVNDSRVGRQLPESGLIALSALQVPAGYMYATCMRR
jgi:hypothetical protein